MYTYPSFSFSGVTLVFSRFQIFMKVSLKPIALLVFKLLSIKNNVNLKNSSMYKEVPLFHLTAFLKLYLESFYIISKVNICNKLQLVYLKSE